MNNKDKIHNVIFDLDGTLLDTSEGIRESVEYTITALGLNKLPQQYLENFIGPPIQTSFARYYGLDEAESQHAANFFRDYYKREALYKARLYEGIIDVLKIFSDNNIKVGIATYKRNDYARLIVDYFGIGNYCASIRGADNDNKLTKSDIINFVMKDFGRASHEDTVYVGDTKLDALAANSVKVGFVAVLYGFGFKNEYDLDCLGVNYRFAIKSPKDILELFNES